MSKNLLTKLTSLTKEELIEILTNLSNENTEARKLVLTFMAAYDPKELYKVLNKELTAIKNGTRFITYAEGNEFTNKLESILNKVDNYLAMQMPNLAITLIKRFIELDSKLFERVDDSNGYLSDVYHHAFKILDKAFSHSDESPKAIADYILSIYFNDDYGNRSTIIDSLNLCLTELVIQAIEFLLPAIKPMASSPEFNHNSPSWNFNAYMKNHYIITIHKKIADKLKDVDKYIELVQLENVDDKNICMVAKRLNDAFRSSEAIEWLNRIQDDSHEALVRDKLLIEAYMLEGDTTQAKSTIWKIFERSLDVNNYFEYLKLAAPDEKQPIKEKALLLAKNSTRLSSAFKFLHDMGEYDAIEHLYFFREGDIDDSDYYVYRKLSTALHQNGKHLIATLLRRRLVNNVLDHARSKSYRYAASDLKLAGDFAAHVNDWRKYPSHADFLQQLRAKHSRKMAFWSLVN